MNHTASQPTFDPNCIFCQIAAGHAPANITYQDERVTVFHDIHPITPVHLLIIPNRHIASLNDTSTDDQDLLGRLVAHAREIAILLGLDQTGYRLVINTGFDAGQTVHHLHLHLLGGASMPFHFGDR